MDDEIWGWSNELSMLPLQSNGHDHDQRRKRLSAVYSLLLEIWELTSIYKI